MAYDDDVACGTSASEAEPRREGTRLRLMIFRRCSTSDTSVTPLVLRLLPTLEDVVATAAGVGADEGRSARVRVPLRAEAAADVEEALRYAGCPDPLLIRRVDRNIIWCSLRSCPCPRTARSTEEKQINKQQQVQHLRSKPTNKPNQWEEMKRKRI